MATELTELEKKQKELNRKLVNPLSKKDLPLKIKYMVKGKDNDSLYSLIPYSFMKEANDKGIRVKDLNPKKRQLKNGDIFEVVDVSPFSSTLFITKDGFGMDKPRLSSWFDLIEDKPALETKAPNSTNTSNNSLEQDLNNSDLGKTARKIQIGFSVVGWGVFGILAYKFWNKSTTWKVMLSIFGAYNLYSTYKVFSKPALQVDNNSDSNTNTGKENTATNTATSTGATSTGTTSTGTTSTGTTSTGTISNLTKTQKIDTLVKSMRNDPTETDMDKFHYDFFNKLSDSELNTWMVLSKALKDASVQQEMQNGKESGYNYLKSKYGLLAGDVDNAMNKYGQALSQLNL